MFVYSVLERYTPTAAAGAGRRRRLPSASCRETCPSCPETCPFWGARATATASDPSSATNPAGPSALRSRLSARRESYSRVLALDPEVDIVNDKTVVFRGSSLAISLLYGDQSDEAQVAEARALFRKLAPMSRRAFGPDHDATLKVRRLYAKSLYVADAASRDDVTKAENILEDVARTARRRASCNQRDRINMALDAAREKLASLQSTRRRSTRTQAALEAAVLAM